MVFLLAAAPAGLFFTLIFSSMADKAWNERKFEEQNNLDAYKTALLSFLSSTISDLFIARDIPAFQR